MLEGRKGGGILRNLSWWGETCDSASRLQLRFDSLRISSKVNSYQRKSTFGPKGEINGNVLDSQNSHEDATF